jgi:rhamnogalacturonan acetylesterase
MRTCLRFCLYIFVFLFGTNTYADAQRLTAIPTLFIIGDSTVNNSDSGMQGWGNVIGDYFDKTRINVENRARGGRSSRTFFTEGLWDRVLAGIKPGDFVLIGFGHNDGGPIDKEKFRGSLKGIGEETQDVDNTMTGKHETIHTYGWYMRKFVSDAKAKGAIPIVFSQIPRNIWKNGKVERVSDNYGLWAKQVAADAKVPFIDLNEIVAERYEKEGAEKVGSTYFTTKDHTHTSPAGARLNAESVVEGIRHLKGSALKKYILKKVKV